MKLTWLHLGLALTAFVPLAVFRVGVPCLLAASTTAIVSLVMLLVHVRTARKAPRMDANMLAQRFHTLFEAATETPEHPIIPWEGASQRHRGLLLRVSEQVLQEMSRD